MAPKGELLAKFKSLGNAVLFASASFWEGVDVPGDALRLVVIDKLPFDVPSDPLVRARCERLEQRGEGAFMGYLVPDAALRLKQGFGRLIRTSHDRGIVAVLDKRITQKGYGRVFLASLPDASRCYSLDEVRAFWNMEPLRDEMDGPPPEDLEP
jgi:ATP-dependent DNA helicase DinG